MADTFPLVYDQAAAIPYRLRNGEIEVFLITSSSGKRWVIPKGLIDPGETAAQAAVRETREEAGVAGVLRQDPVGQYRYAKWGADCEVEVYLLRVTEKLDRWPDRGLRARGWFALADAIPRLRERDLRRIVRKAPYEGDGASAAAS